MYYYVPNWFVQFLFYQHPSITYSRRYIYFLRPVVAPYTEISGTLFWGTFIVLHRQNILYSAQGLSKKCIIYVRVLRKHWKSKRQRLYLWVMNLGVSKITRCPCMSLWSMPIALWHIFWNPKLFQTYTQLNLNSSIGGNSGQKEANSCSNAIIWQSILLVLTGCMSSQGFSQKNLVFIEKQHKIICYSQSQCCPQPHNHCHFCYKIKGKTLLEARIYCILGPRQGPEKGLM